MDEEGIEDFIEDELENLPDFIKEPKEEPTFEDGIVEDEETGFNQPVKVNLHLGFR